MMIDACLSAFWGCFQIRAKYYYPFFHVGCICNSVGSTLTSLLDFRCRFFVIGCSWCRNKSQHAESLLVTPRSFAATTRSYQQALGSSGLLESWENDAMGNGQGWNDSTQHSWGFEVEFAPVTFMVFSVWFKHGFPGGWHFDAVWCPGWFDEWWKFTNIKHWFSDFMNFHEHPTNSYKFPVTRHILLRWIPRHWRKCQRILQFVPGSAACLAGRRTVMNSHEQSGCTGCIDWKKWISSIYQQNGILINFDLDLIWISKTV